MAHNPFAFFNQSGWGHKGAPVLVPMGEMMHLIVAARHGGSHLADPMYWPSGQDPTKDPTWKGTWITSDDLKELRRLAGKPDKRGNFLSRIPFVGNTLNDVLDLAKKVPIVGDILPYAGGPLAPFLGAASFAKDPKGYVVGGVNTLARVGTAGLMPQLPFNFRRR